MNIFPSSDVKPHIRQITEQDIVNWNAPGDISPSTVLRTIYIVETDLITQDEAGVREYILQQGIVINKGEIILIKVGPSLIFEISLDITSPTENEELPDTQTEMTFALFDVNDINILTPVEGEMLPDGDFDITFELV